MDIEARIAQLGADRAIRDLKMRYLRAADAKDVAAMRDCFRPDVRIRFDGFPDFDDREAFLAVYQELGCALGIFDIHHGGTGIIEFDGATRATGWWPLYFHNINLAQRTLMQMGVEYRDMYVFEEGRWWISETASSRKSCLIHQVDEAGDATVVVMGEAPATFG